jgi:hypothetical protein
MCLRCNLDGVAGEELGAPHPCRRSGSALAMFRNQRPLADAHALGGVRRRIPSALINAALQELEASADMSDKKGVKERIATRLTPCTWQGHRAPLRPLALRHYVRRFGAGNGEL